jgi:hypothetical protein
MSSKSYCDIQPVKVSLNQSILISSSRSQHLAVRTRTALSSVHFLQLPRRRDVTNTSRRSAPKSGSSSITRLRSGLNPSGQAPKLSCALAKAAAVFRKVFEACGRYTSGMEVRKLFKSTISPRRRPRMGCQRFVNLQARINNSLNHQLVRLKEFIHKAIIIDTLRDFRSENNHSSINQRMIL